MVAADSSANSPPAVEQSVSRQHGRSARVRHDCQSRTLGTRLLVESFSEIEKLRDGVHAQNTAAAEGGVENVILAGERPGVRCSSLGGGLRATRLDHNDRFGECDFACRRQEASCVTDRLHVQHDAARVRIVAQILDQIAPADVQH